MRADRENAMPLHSFYLAPEAWNPPFTLDEGESGHLARVLRLKKGAEVRLFDGQGRHGLFTVEALHKSAVQLSMLSESRTAAPLVRCTLAAGFSKALRRGWFMEKTVELEASAVWFWQGDHSQASLPESGKSRWVSALITGAKQCESSHIPSLTMISNGVAGLIARLPEFDKTFVLYEGDTQGRHLKREDLLFPPGESGRLLLIVGPEGGFSQREAAALVAAGAVAVSLGDRVLRWETAAVLTLGLAWWARQQS
ncbi:MAG: 16S rRNA (uracil(1498)-N(3))-methyltransferase [Desulfovibrio sp.]|nr:16S rRNA (uracil(1498)-N(3))-methyltransferase [Desulfovibrio sp.]